MRKGITLQVWVQIEGEHPPADDFEAFATAAVQRVIAAGAKKDPARLTYAVVRTAADDDPPDDENMQHA